MREVIGWASSRAKRPDLLGRCVTALRHWLEHPPVSAVYLPTRSAAKRWLRGAMTPRDVLVVTDALRSAGIRFCLAGGWAADALAGVSTRRHDDLDVVLADYESDEPRVRAALADLGYRFVEQAEAGSWMPRRTLLDDGGGHRVEAVSVNWRLLTSSTAGPNQSVSEFTDLVCVGTVGGHQVPCMTREVQLLFRSGYPPRPVDYHDRTTLHALQPTTVPPPGQQPEARSASA